MPLSAGTARVYGTDYCYRARRRPAVSGDESMVHMICLMACCTVASSRVVKNVRVYVCVTVCVRLPARRARPRPAAAARQSRSVLPTTRYALRYSSLAYALRF